jgi:putative glycosyltransferase (TIGR04372 family)
MINRKKIKKNQLKLKIQEILILTISILMVTFINLICLFFTIRIGLINNHRIGHLLGNTELWLRKQARSNQRWQINIFLTGVPANEQLLKMIKRKIFVIKNNLLARIFYQMQLRNKNNKIWINLDDSGFNSWVIWNETKNQIEFTAVEIEKGRIYLKSLGINEGDNYVCFCSRDKSYLNHVRDPNIDGHSSWDYHNYRDCSIYNYLDAAEYLTKCGIWTLRMGAVVEDKITSINKQIIDYAINHRSDFADVYLMTHCKFFLGCTAGNFILPSAFGIPCALANMTPLETVARNANDLFIPKKYWHSGYGRLLKFKEILEIGGGRWHHMQQYRDAGIVVIENTAEEILDLAKEMNARIDGTWITVAGDDDLQASYRSLFTKDSPIYGYPSRVGSIFLRKNSHLLN